ncbi:MAG: phosphatase PAP2/dual specificity phosphatase family protein [Nibricoccus sp.]
MKRPWKAACFAAALTSLLFAIVYNLCNRLTYIRPDVGVWAFQWEQLWPVVPIMIVPYWSIDALFVLSPFLCRTEEEVSVLRCRIVFVICGGALGFLLIPLRFAFPRPHVEGAFAPWFAALYTFDFPHNLFPSLHIALRTLLAHHYVKHSRGVLRSVAHGWFSLIGISTLLTWQHHLVDVLGGFWLAGIALHLFGSEEPSQPRARNRTVAGFYAIGAIVCTQLARLSWPWTFVFVWPAFALGTAAYCYLGHGSFYRKKEGLLTFLTKLFFAPLIAGQWASWWYYRRQSAAWDRLTPRVWLGSVLTEGEAEKAVAEGVTAVLDMTTEFSRPRAFSKIRYLNVPVLDLTAPSIQQFNEAAAFIGRESAEGVVYVHCKAGYSRTAGAAAAWLLATGRAKSAEDAFAQLRAVRPKIVVRPEIREGLAAGKIESSATAAC